MAATKAKVCKDCRKAASPPKPARPAPYPGPRCHTHHKAEARRRKAARHEASVARTYKLEKGQYQALYEMQGGVCYLCRRARGISRKLSVDHDHACCNGPESCGECLRGLLCRKCNDFLGHARDDVNYFVRGIVYLTNPPAKQLKAAADLPPVIGGQ